MTNKRNRRLLTLLSISIIVLVAAGTFGAGLHAAPAASPKTLRIGYQLIPNGDLIVKDRKLLEKALPGVSVKWIKFDSGGDVNTAIVAGSLDIGLAGSSAVTKGLAPPLDIGYRVPWIFDVIGTNEALIARNGTGISSISDLVGKTVGTPFASTSHYSLLAALQSAGVSAAKVKIVDLEPPDIVAAWARGDVDAAYVWTPSLGELRKNGKTLITSAQLAKQGKTTADLAVVSNAFATKYPDVVRTWIAQEDKAVKLWRANPKAAAKSIARQLNLSEADALAQAKELVWLDAKQQVGAKYLGVPGKPGGLVDNLYSAAVFLKSQGKIDAVPGRTVFRKGIANSFAADVAKK